jgi:hypothetical protein
MNCTYEEIKKCGSYCVVKIIPPPEDPIGVTKVVDNGSPPKKQKHVTFDPKPSYIGITPLLPNNKANDSIRIDEFTSFDHASKKKERVSKILEEGFIES